MSDASVDEKSEGTQVFVHYLVKFCSVTYSPPVRPYHSDRSAKRCTQHVHILRGEYCVHPNIFSPFSKILFFLSVCGSGSLILQRHRSVAPPPHRSPSTTQVSCNEPATTPRRMLSPKNARLVGYGTRERHVAWWWYQESTGRQWHPQEILSGILGYGRLRQCTGPPARKTRNPYR